MIINNTYFKNDIYVPKAKPSIVNDLTALSSDLVSFIEEKEIECLIGCLGLSLYTALRGQLDSTQSNLLLSTADQKWDDLLNGVDSYIDPSGKEVSWQGIRFKSKQHDPNAVYDKSFIAYYIYWYFEEDNDIMEYSGGFQKNDAKNADNVSPRPKVIKAWNNFVKLVQGSNSNVNLYLSNIGYGVDFYGGSANEKTTLYKFIKDSNTNAPGTYPGFKPKNWMFKNTFDI